MKGHTVILAGPQQRAMAFTLLDNAPDRSIISVSPPRRTISQNSLLWAMLSDLSRQCPEARRHTPEVWKGLCMHAAGHEIQWEPGLSGQPFPVGFRSSRMNKAQMSELIDWISAYGAEHHVKFHTAEIER